MRIALLFDYPRLDNRRWKQELLAALAPKHQLLVIFGKTRLRDYAGAWTRRRGQVDLRGRLSSAGDGGSRRHTWQVCKDLGVTRAQVASVNGEECRRHLRSFRPDFVVTALDHVLGGKTLAAAPVFLNVHYGVLPHIRGWNATEWSLLLRRELSVSLHRVAPGVDSGAIYGTRPVPVRVGDTLESLRARCQDQARALYEEFFEDPERFLSDAQPNVGGRTYYAMNRQLREVVQDLLRRGRLVR